MKQAIFWWIEISKSMNLYMREKFKKATTTTTAANEQCVQNNVLRNLFCMDCLYTDVCVLRSFVCIVVCSRAQTTGVGGEQSTHAREWEKEREREWVRECVHMFCLALLLLFLSYIESILLAWWFCSFLLQCCIFLCFARFCTHTRNVFVFRFLHIFFLFSFDRTQ